MLFRSLHFLLFHGLVGLLASEVEFFFLFELTCSLFSGVVISFVFCGVCGVYVLLGWQ